MKWKTISINTGEGNVEAISPLVISASRATDIPAFYTPWLMNALDRGWCVTTNPYNGARQFVSFEGTRVVVFWTKNPLPLLPHLEGLDKRGLGYYFLFTLNDYDNEHIEGHVPPLRQRIDTFKRLSETIGKEKIIWRFDPLLLSNPVSLDTLLSRVRNVGEELHQFTNKLVFSFVDIAKYAKVSRAVATSSSGIRELTTGEKHVFARELQTMRRPWAEANPRFATSSCAQDIDLATHGISPNRCVDPALINSLFGHLPGVRELLKPDLFGHVDGQRLKDRGQRELCGCTWSKDIGRYDTCPHLCTYCYANSSPRLVLERFRKHDPGGNSLA